MNREEIKKSDEYLRAMVDCTKGKELAEMLLKWRDELLQSPSLPELREEIKKLYYEAAIRGDLQNETDLIDIDAVWNFFAPHLQPQWVAVSERLPAVQNNLKTVSVDALFYADQNVYSGWYVHGKNEWWSFVDQERENVIIKNVTHWMPLPNVPPNK